MNGVNIATMNVYAPCSNSEKFTLWRYIEQIKSNKNCTIWCVLRDFNSVRFECERSGIRKELTYKTKMDKFNDFIQNYELLDIPVVERKYTWYHPNGMAKSRIDRILVSEEWLQLWPDSKQFIISRLVSDHCVIVVKNSVDWGQNHLEPLICGNR